MKNIVLFVILAILTVAALVAWNVSGNKKIVNSQRVVGVSPTPRKEATNGIRKFIEGLGKGSLFSNRPSIQPLPSVTMGPTPSVMLSKGGVPVLEPSISPVTMIASTDKRVITHTESGFVPSSLTIKNGESIIFVNSVSQGMWIMTDDHPSHERLSGMNMSTSLGKDGIYEYRFDQSGSWGYHNEINVEQKGTIIVQ